MRKNTIFTVLAAAVIGGMIAIGGYKSLEQEVPAYNSIQDRQTELMQQVSHNYSETVPVNLDFTGVAKKATNSVVYIQSKYASTRSQDAFHFGQVMPSMASGSGVIISDDGYIVTNNHVVEDATNVEVTLEDNRSYTAKIIGTDPTTDLALIKINEENLDFLPYGDSDDVTVGQWVLAVGNPYDLTSTVTAGIVSAKARNIGILRDAVNNLQIESFIQTDAAVNPGNSGGALINTSGQLIGINSAIASRTGSYTGYSFAIPVNLVKKVMDDLLEFGIVQRGLLGIQIRDVNAQLAEQENLDVVQGVYVSEVNEGSGADEAGIKKNDVIIGIDGKEIKNTSRLQELVAVHRPGEKVEVELLRDGKQKTFTATLHNLEGTMTVVKRAPAEVIDGASFKALTELESERLGIEGGVKIVDLGEGKWRDAGFEESFIITHVDKQKVTSVDELRAVMRNKNNERVVFLGMFPDGTKSYFSIDW